MIIEKAVAITNWYLLYVIDEGICEALDGNLYVITSNLNSKTDHDKERIINNFLDLLTFYKDLINYYSGSNNLENLILEKIKHLLDAKRDYSFFNKLYYYKFYPERGIRVICNPERWRDVRNACVHNLYCKKQVSSHLFCQTMFYFLEDFKTLCKDLCNLTYNIKEWKIDNKEAYQELLSLYKLF